MVRVVGIDVLVRDADTGSVVENGDSVARSTVVAGSVTCSACGVTFLAIRSLSSSGREEEVFSVASGVSSAEFGGSIWSTEVLTFGANVFTVVEYTFGASDRADSVDVSADLDVVGLSDTVSVRVSVSEGELESFGTLRTVVREELALKAVVRASLTISSLHALEFTGSASSINF